MADASPRTCDGTSIPLFPLYGDSAPWPLPDLLHCETIAARSRVHGWVIAPHRHSGLAQLLWLTGGQVRIQLDGQQHRAQGPVLQYVPPLCVHGFVFSDDVQGHVVTLAAPLLARLGDELGAGDRLRHPMRMVAGETDATLATAFAQLHREYLHEAPAREPMMHALCLQILVRMLRHQSSDARLPSGPRPVRERQLDRFRALVEQHYRKHLPLAYFARHLGTSTASLNRTCRDLAGDSAQSLLHQRLVLEASRHLAYTDKPVQVIADELGFSDPAYFSRFFSRAMGCSPRDYRHRSGARTSAPS
ncbi:MULTISPECIES: helix-turn-helix domain-containing protein [unclassified Luteimonas]